eukprot:TRINITY_DN11551_c0_g1_i3.p1 TRINITY_DN11551_c0_g1~~TRINITY_DN11551_c0_g1_i3.p1  ORF type:complete len:215 (-),score=11.59 TRINITY_DN11551_c0_g1_i3:3-647(-)
MMLSRYGMTLEYNKYDHVQFRIKYGKYLDKLGYLISRLKVYEISNFICFKLKYTEFNHKIVNFAKMVLWNPETDQISDLVWNKCTELELKALDLVVEWLKQFLKDCMFTMEENEKIKADPKTGYHDLFAAIYRLERQRIVSHNIKLIGILKQMITRRMKNENNARGVVSELEDDNNYQTHRIIMRNYLLYLSLQQFLITSCLISAKYICPSTIS